MPKTKEENERIKAERREAILLASLPIFAEKGLSATKISDIADAAGISHGLVYSYFPSKENIFVELINQYISSGQDIIEAIEKEDLSPIEKIVKIFEMLYEANEHDSQSGHFFRLMLQLNYYPHLWKELIIDNYFEDHIYVYISHVIEEGQKQGMFQNGSSHAMSLIMGLIAIGMNMYGENLQIADAKFEDISTIIKKILC